MVLLLTGAAWPTVRSLLRPVCADCGRWPGWPAALVSDESTLEVSWPPDFGVHDDALYKSTFFTFTSLPKCFGLCGNLTTPHSHTIGAAPVGLASNIKAACACLQQRFVCVSEIITGFVAVFSVSPLGGTCCFDVTSPAQIRMLRARNYPQSP